MKGFIRFFFATITCLLCITGSSMASDPQPTLSEDFSGGIAQNWIQSSADNLSPYLIDDDFDNGQLDPAWEINYDQASDWVYTESGTMLTVTDIIKTTTNEGWTSVNLTQYLPSPLSDFNIDFGFSWDSEGSTAAMQNVLIQAYSGGSKIIAVGYSDGWPASHGEQYGMIDGAGASNTGPDSLNPSGTASININRTSGLINVLWDGSSLISGTNSILIDRIDLVFSYYQYDSNNMTSFFGNEAVDFIRVQDSTNNADPPPSVYILTGSSPHLSVTQGSHFLIYGTSGTNEISLDIGAKAELINFPGYNQIHIASSSDLFTVSRSGTVVIFQGSDGTSLKIPTTTSVQTVDFSDGVPLTLSIHNGQVMLDDQVVTTTAVAISGEPGLPGPCGAYVAPNVWKEFDCYNLAAVGKTTNDDPFTPSWRLIGGYWQWGRKGPDSSVWHIINTEHFAHGPTGPGSGEANSGEISGWDQTNAPDVAWFDSHKTANDPCLSGFRVPTKSQWQGVVDNNSQSTVGTWSANWDDYTNYSAARFFGDRLMLPAAGYRLDVDSALYLRGSHGYYCSSSQHDGSHSSWHLDFYRWAASTSVSGSLNGLSVRCVAE